VWAGIYASKDCGRIDPEENPFYNDLDAQIDENQREEKQLGNEDKEYVDCRVEMPKKGVLSVWNSLLIIHYCKLVIVTFKVLKKFASKWTT
jgi:hypothetical protein